jgi:AmmeMemoRadiSam system protein A
VEVDPYIALARLSVETFVRTGKPAALPADTPSELLSRRAGVFVSLHERGDLRGCIGTIAATRGSIAQEIIQNGISACSRDPRFDPVRPDELDYLEYSVDVLGDAEPIDSPSELNPERYGVIVTKGWKRGLLLPNLDGVDTVELQLAIAKQKAGIDPRDGRVQLERFEVVRHTAGGAARRP